MNTGTYKVTPFEKLRLLIAQFLARLVVLALPPRFRPEPPIPKLKKSLVKMATQPLPDRGVDYTRGDPHGVPGSYLDRQAVVKKQRTEIEKIMQGKKSYEQQKEDAAQLMRDLAKKE